MISGFEAMGEPVPEFRKKMADKHLEDMGVTNRVDQWRIVGQMSTALEKDDPRRAIEIAEEHLDYYGARRLLAVLLAAEKPEKFDAERSGGDTDE